MVFITGQNKHPSTTTHTPVVSDYQHFNLGRQFGKLLKNKWLLSLIHI